MPCLNRDKIFPVCYQQYFTYFSTHFWWYIRERCPTLGKRSNFLPKIACFWRNFTGCRGHAIRDRANVAMTLICEKKYLWAYFFFFAVLKFQFWLQAHDRPNECSTKIVIHANIYSRKTLLHFFNVYFDRFYFRRNKGTISFRC